MSQPVKDDKQIIFEDEARAAVLEGARIMYDTVTLTYGPKGKNVLIEKIYGRPTLTRDGVTVAREVYSKERGINMGMQLLEEASQTTNRIAGDGTTATVAVAYNLLKLAMKKIGNGDDPMVVRQQILDDSYKVLDNLKTISKDVVAGQLQQVATVSSGDANLGQLIAEAVEEVGADGGLITEKAPITGVDRKYVNGYFLQQGFTAIASGKKDLDNPYVVITSKLLGSGVDVVELLNKVFTMAYTEQGIAPGQPLPQPVRIAFFGEIEGDAYNTIVANIQKGVFDGAIVKTPPMGEISVQYLEDLAVYTGGKSLAQGENLSSFDETYVGRADKVTATMTETTVFGGHGAQEDIDNRLQEIKDRLKTEEIDAIAEKLRDRLAKLEGKIAVFRIGGATDTERDEKEFRIEDAIQATKAAANYGVVPGGGATLIALANTEGISDLTKQALEETFKRLVENAGLSGDVELDKMSNAKPGVGYNLRKGSELVDVVAEGILDPTLVVEQTIENAASTAGNAATVGAIITFTDKKEDE